MSALTGADDGGVDTVNLGWAPPFGEIDEYRWLRMGMNSAYAVLRQSEWRRQRELIEADLVAMLDASVVRVYEPGGDGEPLRIVGEPDPALPPDALRMERELLRRALAQETSLISNHPLLDPLLSSLAESCRLQRLLTHVMLVRAHGRTRCAFVVHWINRERPPYERRAGFYSYWDTVSLAVAAAQERARIEAELDELRKRARRDELTGLPNGFALDEQLRQHEQTALLSVLALDFDGMKEANTVFKSYELGGDVLIKAIGQALPALARNGEFPARLHIAGDEFAVLLPHADEATAARRANEIETQLDALEVPASHRPVYKGASVGYATRRTDETPGQTLGRAIDTMLERKRIRHGLRETRRNFR